MRGKNPDYIDASCRERDRVARDKFAEERESYREEAEADDFISKAVEVSILSAHLLGVQQERTRILTSLCCLERDTAALWQEGTPVTKAVAAYTAAVRKIVEGEGK